MNQSFFALQFTQTIKQLMEQRWTIWYQKLDLLLSELAFENKISREAVLQVFGSKNEWCDTSMVALCKTQPGNTFMFQDSALEDMCTEKTIESCKDKLLVEHQKRALLFGAKHIFGWQKTN